jgi:hypothetical protein
MWHACKVVKDSFSGRTDAKIVPLSLVVVVVVVVRGSRAL